MKKGVRNVSSALVPVFRSWPPIHAREQQPHTGAGIYCPRCNNTQGYIITDEDAIVSLIFMDFKRPSLKTGRLNFNNTFILKELKGLSLQTRKIYAAKIQKIFRPRKYSSKKRRPQPDEC